MRQLSLNVDFLSYLEDSKILSIQFWSLSDPVSEKRVRKSPTFFSVCGYFLTFRRGPPSAKSETCKTLITLHSNIYRTSESCKLTAKLRGKIERKHDGKKRIRSTTTECRSL